MPRLLLVEDNEMNRDMLSRRLKRKDFDVEMAVNGQQAVEMSKQEDFDLILMDMSLPVMDGWEATSLIKNHPLTKAVPIIGLSAHAMAGDREKGLAVGCDEYETKPVDFPRLMEKITDLLK